MDQSEPNEGKQIQSQTNFNIQFKLFSCSTINCFQNRGWPSGYPILINHTSSSSFFFLSISFSSSCLRRVSCSSSSTFRARATWYCAWLSKSLVCLCRWNDVLYVNPTLTCLCKHGISFLPFHTHILVIKVLLFILVILRIKMHTEMFRCFIINNIHGKIT